MRNVGLILFPLFLILPGCVEESSAGRQAWIISPSDGVNRTHCVSWTDSNTTALDTLKGTGETLEILEDPAMGAAVCKIGETGWPVSGCFGGADGTDATWMYYVWNEVTGAWESATTSISNLDVSDGDLLAFVFTTYDSSFNPVRIPPVIRFDEICNHD